jgi:hypothetical protein
METRGTTEATTYIGSNVQRVTRLLDYLRKCQNKNGKSGPIRPQCPTVDVETASHERIRWHFERHRPVVYFTLVLLHY